MSRLSAILYVVDWRKSAYYIVCKKEIFVAESGERVQKRTNFPKICSFLLIHIAECCILQYSLKSEGIETPFDAP